MHEIEVVTIAVPRRPSTALPNSGQAAEIAYTLLDDGDLKLRFVPRHDGTPVVGMHILTEALAEVQRALAVC